MVKRMLIDAAHLEETRVAVVSGNRLEELDFETATKRQLKGNIYLAKITRVEPSLQAAFVDYGGNRHGFLAFTEIHPDYYRIPIADREALIAEDAAQVRPESPAEAPPASAGNGSTPSGEGAAPAEIVRGPSVETVGGDEVEEIGRYHMSAARRYRIQEVISRRQIMLVQVVKEERGTKGAALTTYISLAGRYCVLMPNTPRGGGISRKITNASDRKRLRSILDDLDIPAGMAVILRTAGMERSKAEIKRDYDYLLRLWDEIREQTLKSTAPALIHEEANLIKRSIRDLYSRDIEEVWVEGDDGYRVAKDFMRMLIPSHARKVQPYKEAAIPLFHRYQVEGQIDDMHSPVVNLKSGGYIVINSTEALVAIDVNSGRATRERNIEETARRTNLEAAEEIALQLRLRDLAGLIVIDFIDMEETRNQQRVEKRLKEAMRHDRARIQLGRISPFGLLEMSRQRLRPSLIEASMESCPTCGGSGHVRSTESTALHVLRALEEEGMRKRSRSVTVYVPAGVALYVLNRKRNALTEIEKRHGFSVEIATDNSLVPPDLRIERVGGRGAGAEETAEAVEAPAGEAAAETEGRRRRGRRRRTKEPAEVAAPAEPAEESESEEPAAEAAEQTEGEEIRKPRRRGKRGGRRRSRRGAKADETVRGAAEGEAPEQDAAGETAEPAPVGAAEDQPTADAEAMTPPQPFEEPATAAPDAVPETAEAAAEPPGSSPEPTAKPKRAPRRRRATKPAAPPAEKEAGAGNGEAASDNGKTRRPAPRHKEARASETAEPSAAEPAAEPEGAAPAAPADDRDRPARKGWWNRILQQ